MKNIIICGDIHGDWGPLNTLINKKKPDIVLQCGDWGWWPHYHNKFGLVSKTVRFNQYGVKNKQNDKLTEIYWCPGNHENWDDLDKYKNLTELQEGVFYCPFGTVMNIDGYNVLFVGGAESTDKQYRIEGISWWRQETISQKDIDKLPKNVNIDIVVSHTIPTRFFKYANFNHHKYGRITDPSCAALDIVFDKYKPKYWFSGHFHIYLKTYVDGCKWISLATCSYETGQWWMDFKKV